MLSWQQQLGKKVTLEHGISGATSNSGQSDFQTLGVLESITSQDMPEFSSYAAL
jgi:hypothetical protein